MEMPFTRQFTFYIAAVAALSTMCTDMMEAFPLPRHDIRKSTGSDFLSTLQQSTNTFQKPLWAVSTAETMVVNETGCRSTSDQTMVENKEEATDDMDQKFSLMPDVTHFCFLVHGYQGLGSDLRYMQVAMRRMAAKEKKRKQSQRPGRFQAPDKDPFDRQHNIQQHKLIVHSARCNEYKTSDGIQNGGDRLMKEMHQVITSTIKRRRQHGLESGHPSKSSGSIKNGENLQDVTISIVGNSLGGLFGRFAIAKFLEDCVKVDSENGDETFWILDGKIRIHLNIFCTTATPHLGVSRHTYVPIPRSAEIGVASAMGETGKDLFRLNDLLEKMATCSTFIGPLSQFRRRIAYANAYGTDFPVPVGTAAFLSDHSGYPHYFVNPGKKDCSQGSSSGVNTNYRQINNQLDTSRTWKKPDNENSFIIASLYTPPNHDVETYTKRSVQKVQSEHDGILHQMSISLDRLGWKKVFVDIRKQLPSLKLPRNSKIRRERLQLWRSLFWTQPSEESLGQSESQYPKNDECESIDWRTLRERGVVSSRDLADAVTLPQNNHFSLPIGHNMIVAFSRNPFASYINQGGRPVVDSLAEELVKSIFA